MATRLAQRLLIVGWDAADWKIIEALLGHGRMPVLKRLIDEGMRGDLATLQPALSPLLWTSIATGKTADKHGILNFVEPEPSTGLLRPAASTTRGTKALWNILSQSGLRTNVVSWYASHPAEPIHGTCISNLFQENPPRDPAAAWSIPDGAVHPPEARERAAELRMHPAEIHAQELQSFGIQLTPDDIRDPRIAALAIQVARCASVHNIATWLLETGEPWDCTMVFYDIIDVVGHHFMQYHPPRMEHVSERDFERFRHVMYGVYQLQDMMLGRLLDLAGPGTTVMVLSDHGFHSDHLRPRVQAALDDPHAAMDASWHRNLGMLVISGPGVRAAQDDDRIHGAGLLDITPTALALLGLPVGADMDGRILVEALAAPIEVERVFSWDALEGDSGMHPADVRVDPFDSAGVMAHLAELGYVQSLPEDAAQQVALVERETRFNLGIVYMTTRRVREAIAILQELAAAHPDEPRYVINLIQCLLNVGRHAEAREFLSVFLRHHPGHPDANVYLAMALFAEGRREEAAEVLSTVERAGEARPDLDCMLGTVNVHLGRLDEAERAFARAVSVNPHDPAAHHGLALVALNREQFDQAVNHALTAVGLHHFFPDAHYTLGVALTWMQDFDHAIKAFQVAVSMQPGLIDAHRFLASIYRHLRDRTNAARHRDIATQLIQDHTHGQHSGIADLREPPMGPQEWARRLGGSEA